jgi:hypothetical protein
LDDIKAMVVHKVRPKSVCELIGVCKVLLLLLLLLLEAVKLPE